jgi:hypothetical protein
MKMMMIDFTCIDWEYKPYHSQDLDIGELFYSAIDSGYKPAGMTIDGERVPG